MSPPRLEPLSTLTALRTAARSRRLAGERGLMGLEFADFGRRLAWRAAAAGPLRAAKLWATPVNCVRYFEFDFAWRHLPAHVNQLVDVSSPRLFVLRVAAERRARWAVAVNPDAEDLGETVRLQHLAGIKGLSAMNAYVEQLAIPADSVDVVSCISVVEHIATPQGDTGAMRQMYDLLRPGGTLLVTVPVARQARVDYRDRPAYAIDGVTDDDGSAWFFERVYDQALIEQNLLSACPGAEVAIEFFGELHPGTLDTYIERWREAGWQFTADDAAMMSSGFARFVTHAEMPGSGVCGIAIRKPA